MKAIVVRQKEPAPMLSWETVPDPGCGASEVMVEVHATAVNRADLLQARGLYPPPKGDSPILGLELAGTISHLGPAVEGWRVGDRICALAPGGGYSQLAGVDHRMLLKLPDDWSFAKGAAVPEVWLTAHSNLFMEGSLAPGETLLVHAGASGVGTAAIQLAAASRAAVIVTAGTEEKRQRCIELGATHAIDYKEKDFAEEIDAFTQGRGVDLVLDCVGGTYFASHLKILRPYGRLVSIGLLGGRKGEMDMAALLMKSLRIIGSRLRARTLDQKIEITRDFRKRFWPLLVNGSLTPVIDSVFPIEEAQSAHAYIEDNRNIGKVILEIRSPSK